MTEQERDLLKVMTDAYIVNTRKKAKKVLKTYSKIETLKE
jgi:hypothetical protein